MSFLSKLDPKAKGDASASPVEGLLAQLPGVREYLASDRWPDGTARDQSSLIVLIDRAGVRCCLSDKANERTLWRTGPSLEEVLLALELAVTEGPADWRSSQPRPGGKKR